ncbi:MAG: acylneuraminate cytidylyltransferase family protein, partial [Spirochaetota bacterium]|nr:acylneuraminate cytidylyltransferase family protein [Spirochaetota bacterium]
FRSPESIRDAWERYKLYKPESLRSIERCKQHPYKMWIKKEDHILPLSSMMTLPEKCNYYEMPTQILPEIYVQNAALEIAKMSNIAKYDNVSGSGQGIIYYEFPGREGFDINDMDDWHIAENIMGGNLP